VQDKLKAQLSWPDQLIAFGAVLAWVCWFFGGHLLAGNWYGESGAAWYGAIAFFFSVVSVVIVGSKQMLSKIPTFAVHAAQLVSGAGAAVAGVIGAVLAITYDPFGGVPAGFLLPDKPVILPLAAVAVAIGGVLQLYGAFIGARSPKPA
jgi:hypothetical protein